jgi:hypothetical protein
VYDAAEALIPTVNINAIWSPGEEIPSQAARQWLGDADIIKYRHIMVPQAQDIIFGKAVLEEIARSGQRRGCRVVRVEIDRDNPQDFNALVRVVRALKGRIDYSD